MHLKNLSISLTLFAIGATVFYPSDAVATERATELAANTRGVCFIRNIVITNNSVQRTLQRKFYCLF